MAAMKIHFSCLGRPRPFSILILISLWVVLWFVYWTHLPYQSQRDRVPAEVIFALDWMVVAFALIGTRNHGQDRD